MKYTVTALIVGLAIGFAAGWFARPSGEPGHGDAHKEHGHVAHHGGTLNAIEKCEIGHIEVKVGNGAIECWFVGGGHDTDKSVRIPDAQIGLAVTFEGKPDATLTLLPEPLELAGETVGDCSHFTGAAEWLTEDAEFHALGKATECR